MIRHRLFALAVAALVFPSTARAQKDEPPPEKQKVEEPPPEKQKTEEPPASKEPEFKKDPPPVGFPPVIDKPVVIEKLPPPPPPDAAFKDTGFQFGVFVYAIELIKLAYWRCVRAGQCPADRNANANQATANADARFLPFFEAVIREAYRDLVAHGVKLVFLVFDFYLIYYPTPGSAPTPSRLFARMVDLAAEFGLRLYIQPQFTFSFSSDPTSTGTPADLDVARAAGEFFASHAHRTSIAGWSITEEPPLARHPLLYRLFSAVAETYPGANLKLTYSDRLARVPELPPAGTPLPAITAINSYPFEHFSFTLLLDQEDRVDLEQRPDGSYPGDHVRGPTEALITGRKRTCESFGNIRAYNPNSMLAYVGPGATSGRVVTRTERERAVQRGTVQNLTNARNFMANGQNGFLPIPAGARVIPNVSDYLGSYGTLMNAASAPETNNPSHYVIDWQYYRPPAGATRAGAWMTLAHGGRAYLKWWYMPPLDPGYYVTDPQRAVIQAAGRTISLKNGLGGRLGQPNPQFDELATTARDIGRFSRVIPRLGPPGSGRTTLFPPRDPALSCGATALGPIIEKSFSVRGVPGTVVVIYNEDIGRASATPDVPESIVVNERGDLTTFLPSPPRVIRFVPVGMGSGDAVVDLSTRERVPRNAAGYKLLLGPGHGTMLYVGPAADAERLMALVRPH